MKQEQMYGTLKKICKITYDGGYAYQWKKNPADSMLGEQCPPGKKCVIQKNSKPITLIKIDNVLEA